MKTKNILLLFIFLNQILSFGENKTEVDSLLNVAESSLKTGEYIKALELVSTVEEKCKSSEIYLARAYIISSDIYIKVSKYSDAIEKLMLAQKIAIKENNKKMMAEIYSNLAVLYFETANNKQDYIHKAEDNIKKAYQIVKKHKLKNNEIILNYGVIIYMYNNPDSALSYFLKEKKLIQPNNYLDHIYINDYIGHIYKNKKDYKSALKYHYESLKDSKLDKNHSLMAMNYANIAYSYFMLNKTDSAFTIAHESFKMGKETNNKYAMEQALDILSDIYYKNNDIKNYRKYILITDSIQNIYYGNETTKEIAKMEFLYKTKIKDLRIGILEKENRFKHEKMKIQILLFSIIAFILLVIIVILVKQTKYRRLIYKQKILLLNEEKEKTKYKNDKLKDEMKIRNRELITKTLLIADNKRLLENISTEIKNIIKNNPNTKWDDLTKILNTIKKDSKSFWDDFFLYFDGIHTGFLQKLDITSPNMTSTEKKVCVLIKLNLSTNDISKITFNSPRTIEKHRSNIRKKLNLNKSDDLHQFLNQL